MSAIKKVWVTKQESGLVSLSLESITPIPEHMRLKVKELAFPEKPTKEHPKRHTITISLLDIEDLELIQDTINAYLYDRGE